MWIVVLLAGIAALVALAWKASRHRRTRPATGSGGPDTFPAGESASGTDYTASDYTASDGTASDGTASDGAAPGCTDSAGDSGGCDGDGGGGD